MNSKRIYFYCRTAVILSLLFLQACSSLPKTYQAQQQLSPEERAGFNLAVYDKAWDLVNRKYHDPEFNGADWLALQDEYRENAASAADTVELYSVINELLDNIGESHLSARGVRNPDRNTTGTGTYGFTFKVVDGQPVVSDVFPDSPAEDYGVEPGWLINAYNDIAYPASPDAFPVNTSLNYTANTADAGSFTFTDKNSLQHRIVLAAEEKISPATDPDSFKAVELSDGYMYLRIPVFRKAYISSLKDTLTQHADARGIVIDLRDNPGGIVYYELKALGFFSADWLRPGYTVQLRKEKERMIRYPPWGSMHFKGDVVVLINNRSASASEVFASVLQHYGRAVIVGQKSSGSVLGTRNFKLPDGGRITIPISDYLGPDRQRLEGRGVTPDIEVPLPTIDDLRKNPERDLELETAIKVLKGEIT